MKNHILLTTLLLFFVSFCGVAQSSSNLNVGQENRIDAGVDIPLYIGSDSEYLYYTAFEDKKRTLLKYSKSDLSMIKSVIVDSVINNQVYTINSFINLGEEIIVVTYVKVKKQKNLKIFMHLINKDFLTIGKPVFLTNGYWGGDAERKEIAWMRRELNTGEMGCLLYSEENRSEWKNISPDQTHCAMLFTSYRGDTAHIALVNQDLEVLKNISLPLHLKRFIIESSVLTNDLMLYIVGVQGVSNSLSSLSVGTRLIYQVDLHSGEVKIQELLSGDKKLFSAYLEQNSVTDEVFLSGFLYNGNPLETRSLQFTNFKKDFESLNSTELSFSEEFLLSGQTESWKNKNAKNPMKLNLNDFYIRKQYVNSKGEIYVFADENIVSTAGYHESNPVMAGNSNPVAMNTPSAGFIFTGNILVIKLSSHGDIIWQKLLLRQQTYDREHSKMYSCSPYLINDEIFVFVNLFESCLNELSLECEGNVVGAIIHLGNDGTLKIIKCFQDSASDINMYPLLTKKISTNQIYIPLVAKKIYKHGIYSIN